ncbi:MAG: hypothetical protein AAGI52_05470 [Bacteroidota bacterium]
MLPSGFAERLLVAASAFGAGLALGLLLAPDAGDATRARIASGARDAASAASDRSREWAAPVTEAARQSAQHLAERHLPLAEDFDLVDGETIRQAVREDGL